MEKSGSDNFVNIDEYIPKYPANIYKVYKEYSKADSYVRKLSLMFDIYGQVIRFFGCVFLSDYLYSTEEKDIKVQERLNASITALARPSLGSWFGFVREYARTDGFIAGFHDVFSDIYKKRDFTLKYHGRFRNEDMKQGNAFDEILSLRNAIAHGAMSPTEEEAAELVEVYSQYIEAILDGFSVIFNDYAVVKVDEMEDDFDTVTVYLDIINYDVKMNERISVEYPADFAEDVFNERGMYLICRDKRILRLAEYLIDLVDDREHEDYYLFDGFGNKKVTYLGMIYKKQIESYLDAIKSRFMEKGGGLKWTRKAFVAESFCGTLNDLSELAVDIHKKSGKYTPDVYVERECDMLAEEFLASDKTTMVVTAEAGVGKTNFLCHLAEKLIKQGATTYFYNGGSLIDTGKENILFLRLQSECLDSSDFHSMRDFLRFFGDNNKEGKPLVFLIDAANEAYDMLNVLREIDEMTSEGDEFPWLKIMVSVRKVSYEIFKSRMTDEYGKKLPFFTLRDRYFSVYKENAVRYTVEIEEWNIMQVIDAFDKYKCYKGNKAEELSFHSLSREVQLLLCNPLNMGLFFTALDYTSGKGIRSEEDIFDAMEKAWFENDEVTDSMNRLKNNIVEEMKKTRKNELDSDIVSEMDDKVLSRSNPDIRLLLLSPLERLKDAGIIYEKQENDYAVTGFVYQKYLEYLLLQQIKTEKKEAAEVVELMLDAMSWDALPEMYISCLQFIKQQDNVIDICEQMISLAQKRNIPLSKLESTLKVLWHKEALNGNSEKLVKHICEYGYREAGIELVKELCEREESDASIKLIEAMLDDQMLADNSELIYLRGLYSMKVSDLECAKECFEKCIAADDGNYSEAAMVQLAKNYRKSGDVSAASSILGKYLEDNDEEKTYYADAMIQRGLCKFSDKNIQGALDDYMIALDISKKKKDHYVTLYNLLGISTAKANLGELDACEEILLDVYNRSGQYGYIDLLSDSLNGLSSNFVRKGDYERAYNYAVQGLMIWRHSHYYTGQMVMFCTIIKALRGMGGKEKEIEQYKKEAEEVLPLIKEKVILDIYENTMKG